MDDIRITYVFSVERGIRKAVRELITARPGLQVEERFRFPWFTTTFRVTGAPWSVEALRAAVDRKLDEEWLDQAW